jgi:hypothetical protein
VAQEVAGAIVELGTGAVAFHLPTTSDTLNLALGILKWAQTNKKANEISIAATEVKAPLVRSTI